VIIKVEIPDKTLRCTQSGCGTIVAEIKEGCLVILARHHGEIHRSSFPLVEILEEKKETVASKA